MRKPRLLDIARVGRRKLAGVAAAVLIGGVSSLVVASPAQAYVWDCHAWAIGNAGWALCFEGTGSYRVLVDCANVGRVVPISGPWKYRHWSDESTWASIAGCGEGFPTNVRVEAR